MLASLLWQVRSSVCTVLSHLNIALVYLVYNLAYPAPFVGGPCSVTNSLHRQRRGKTSHSWYVSCSAARRPIFA